MSENMVSVEERSTELVGHCMKDDADHSFYVGRGYDGEHMMSDDIKVGQRGWLGNPFEVGEDIVMNGEVVVQDATREKVVEWFEKVFVFRLEEDSHFRSSVKALAGMPLDCWCQERDDNGPACHGEVIAKWALKLANRGGN